MTYRSTLIINFLALFVLFTAALAVFQYNRERTYRRDILEARLESYADVMAAEAESGGAVRLDSLTDALPAELRVTIIKTDGNVVYDSSRNRPSAMNNHLNRPEVRQTISCGRGSDIRRSATDHIDYFYFSKSYGNHIVRVALPYDATVRSLMKADNVFLWFVLLLFPIVLVLLIRISGRVGRAISELRNFMHAAERGLVDYGRIRFPHTELGDIGHSIMLKYQELEASHRMLSAERERLLRHFHYFGGGIAIFSPELRRTYANPRFTQYVNALLEHPTADIDVIWAAPAFAPAADFVRLNGGARPSTEAAPVFAYDLRSGSCTYRAQILIYGDGSVELTLTDITAEEKNRRLKQQMSQNISHELRTPVSSIRGYLETLRDCANLSEERKSRFLDKACAQADRLTDLLRDVALISRMEEAPGLMPREAVNVKKVVNEVKEELQKELEESGSSFLTEIPDSLYIEGNCSLLYSIFRNLTENALRHGGGTVGIRVCCYNAADGFAYFSFSDTGCGVPEEHLPRLFERFYRVAEGRTRDSGGTGLGLSIVRNAVRFHRGDISVRNRRTGGLEFLFTLHL